MLRKSILFLTVWMGAILTAGGSFAASAHDFTGRCEQCHVSDPQGGTLIFMSDIGSLCRACHDRFITGDHPSQGTPSMAFPAEFQWDQSGNLDEQLSCATCHDPHADGEAAARFMLRGSAEGTDFCRRCHSEAVTSEGRHLAVAFLAHRPMGDTQQTTSITTLATTTATSELDPISSECLSCHDGSAGPHAGFCLLMQEGKGCDGHIVSSSYAEVTAGNPGYHSVAEVAETLSLLDGVITCATCHNIYSHTGPMLAVDNTGSALCQVCHIK